MASRKHHYLTVADLQAGTGHVDGDVVLVHERSTGTSLGGGEFRYDSGSSATVDTGYVFDATGMGAGRWIRVTDHLTPEMYGAAGDDTTNDKDEVQAAMVGANTHNLPCEITSKHYLATGVAITAPDRLTIRGHRGSWLRTDQNIQILELNGTNVRPSVQDLDVTVEGITFVGANTGAAEKAVHIRDVGNAVVRNCVCRNFGTTASTTRGIINFEYCHQLQAHGNYIVGCKAGSTAGISVSQCQEFTISDNRIVGVPGTVVSGVTTTSTISEGITVGSSSASYDQRGSITGNVILSPARHCILVGYGYTPRVMGVTVSGNVCWNAPWTGVYLAGNGSHGPVAITGNVFAHCGGANAIGGGVHANSDMGTTITGNIFYKTAIAEGGEERYQDFFVPSIRMRGTWSQNVSVSGNTFLDARNSHVLIDTVTGTGEAFTSISSNYFVDSGKAAISIGAVNAAKNPGKTLISGNIIRYETRDTDGIEIFNTGGDPGRVVIEGNYLIGRKAGTGKAGLYFKNAAAWPGIARDNYFDNWDYAINQAAAIADMHFGNVFRVVGNHVHECGTKAFNLFAGEYAVIEDTSFSGTIADSGFDSTTFTGRRQPQQNNRWDIYTDTTPAGGTWSVGDQQLYLTPVAGGKIGKVCTTGGTPGTWTEWGAIANDLVKQTWSLFVGVDATTGVDIAPPLYMGDEDIVQVVAATATGNGPIGAALLFDVNRNGTTIFTNQVNRVTIADGQTKGSTSTIEAGSCNEGDLLTVDCDQVGSTTAGQSITVTIWSRQR